MKKDTKIPFTPAPGYSICVPYEEENKGGFVTPDSVKNTEKHVKVTVIASSDKDYISMYGSCVSKPEFVVEDAVIVIKDWGKQEITEEGKKYFIVNHGDIVAQVNV